MLLHLDTDKPDLVQRDGSESAAVQRMFRRIPESDSMFCLSEPKTKIFKFFNKFMRPHCETNAGDEVE